MVHKKLSDNSGASLLIALLFFTICAVIGTLIITISMAASGRMHNLKSDQQSYYTMYSAAKLLAEEISDTSYSKYIEIDSDNNETSEYLEKPDSTFQELLLKYADAILDANAIEESTTIKISLPSEHTNIEPVTVIFHMDSQYNISLELYEESEPDIVYEVTIPAIISQDKVKTTLIQNDKEYTRYTTSVNWGKAEIYKK